jgi:four helix bundle protein
MSDGEPLRRNKNRGYQQLRVWEDAISLFSGVLCAVRGWPYELKRLSSQFIAGADSVHRNIAEGYARRSIREYLNFLNIALGSLAETVSAIHAYHRTNKLSDEQFEELDALSFKLENGMLRLVAALEEKRDRGEWQDSLVVQESNSIYG